MESGYDALDSSRKGFLQMYGKLRRTISTLNQEFASEKRPYRSDYNTLLSRANAELEELLNIRNNIVEISDNESGNSNSLAKRVTGTLISIGRRVVEIEKQIGNLPERQFV